MIVLLAFLPLQAWAGIGATPSGTALVQPAHAVAMAQDNVAVAADQADFATPASPESSPAAPAAPTDSADPPPPGADFAEQLLPAPMPRVTVSAARSAVPRYASASLPDPDLPRLPRPPRG